MSLKENLIRTFFFSIAIVSALLLVFILFFILKESGPIWAQVGIINFLTKSTWQPTATPPQFSILPMLVSTLWVAFGALAIAIPFGFTCAIFLAEFAPAALARLIRPVLNMLTGIPSVVYGFLGATVLIRYLEVSFDLASGESLFAASLVLALMVLPFIIANSENALRSVPQEYRQAGIALGISKQYTAVHILVPLAIRGMLGAVILAFGRAIGETMAVLMLAGNILKIPFSWFAKGEPLPALIALELGSATPGTSHYQALFATGFLLVLIVIMVNISINLFLRHWQRGL